LLIKVKENGNFTVETQWTAFHPERAPVAAREECDRNTGGVIPTKGRRQCPSSGEVTSRGTRFGRAHYKVMGQAKRGICLSRSPLPELIKQIPRRPSGFVGMTGHILFNKVPRRAKGKTRPPYHANAWHRQALFSSCGLEQSGRNDDLGDSRSCFLGDGLKVFLCDSAVNMF
jgi:hypothetical protein